MEDVKCLKCGLEAVPYNEECPNCLTVQTHGGVNLDELANLLVVFVSGALSWIKKNGLDSEGKVSGN